MNTKYPDVPWIDPNFHRNWLNFPQEELDKYIGRHVAYSWDGTRIVASGADEEELARNLTAAGIDPSRVVWGYVDDPNVSNLE